MFINLKQHIGKDVDLNPAQIIAITIRGVEVVESKGGEKLINSDTPQKWVVDVLTPLMAMCFSVQFSKEQAAIDFRNMLKGEPGL